MLYVCFVEPIELLSNCDAFEHKTLTHILEIYLQIREQRARQRYSVEVANAGNYLNIRPSTLETLNKSGQSSIFNRRNRKTNVSEEFLTI